MIPVILAAVAIASFCTAIGLMIAANLTCYAILVEVNQRRPPDEQIREFFLGTRLFSVLSLHSEIYPDSPKRRRMWSLALSAVTLGFCGFAAMIFR